MIHTKLAFWLNRAKEMRLILIFGGISNLFYQIPALISPWSKAHFIVNIMYTLVTLFQFTTVWLSYRNEAKYAKLLREAAFLFLVRNSIRCFDFEQSKSVINPAQWNLLVNQQTAIIMYIMASFFKAFDNSEPIMLAEIGIAMLLNISAMIYGQGLDRFD